jgi:hypothetical protein
LTPLAEEAIAHCIPQTYPYFLNRSLGCDSLFKALASTNFIDGDDFRFWINLSTFTRRCMKKLKMFTQRNLDK